MDRLGATATGVFGVIVPMSCGALAVALANLPISLLGGLVPPPLLALMPVYFWCLVRPDLMPPALAFAIGVLEDLFSGGPPGVWGASFVAAYAVIDRQRDSFAGLSGVGAVLGFATAMLITAGTAYAIVSVYYWRLPPLAPVVVEITVSVLFYLPAAVVLGWIHRHFVGALRSEA